MSLIIYKRSIFAIIPKLNVMCILNLANKKNNIKIY